MWPDNRKVGWRWEREQRLTSIHESSHAVVAHLVGSRASIRLTVALDDRGRTSFGGLVTTATPRRRERSSPFFRHALVAAAGPIGEAKYCREMRWPRPDDDCMAADLANVKADVARIDLDRAYSVILDRARRILDEPDVWRGVIALADALDAVWPDLGGVGEMSPAAVRGVCAGFLDGYNGRRSA
jgi:hypothetical protein